MFADVLVVLCNLPDEALARTLARELVEARLAACANVLPAVASVYRWQGRTEEATEVPLLIKTTRGCYPALERALRARHPYELPEILALPVAGGFQDYLRWVAGETDHA